MEEIQAELKKYPSSFDVFENLPASTEDIRKIKDKLLLEEKSDEFDTDMEWNRTWNMISFLCFVLKDRTGAETYSEKVLKNDPDNMIGLSNKLWFSLKQCSTDQQFTDYRRKLEELKNDTFACLVAKAEIAFTFSRLGVKRYEKAKSLYKNVIDECGKIMAKERNRDIKLLTSNLCIWTFGYALVQRRLLNVSNTFDETELDLSADTYRCVKQLFYDIIHQKKRSKCVRRYQARSYIELGFFSYNTQNLSLSDASDPDNVDLPKQTEEYFSKALKIFPDDVYVLQRSGQYYRYAGNIELSIELLTKAVNLKGTSHAYHHLAFSMRRKLEIDLGNCKPKTFKPPCASNKSRSLTPIKLPLVLTTIDHTANEEVADEILRCLNKSIEISFNTAAMYDKGLFYKQLGMLDKALESFERLIRNEEEHSSRIDMANAFEQAGLCLRHMLKQDDKKEQREDLKQKMKMYLKSSIEISCSIVANIPWLKTCWKSASVLESVISGASTKENKDDLLFLCNKMEKHQEALEILKELEQLAQTQDESVKILQEQVGKYLTLGRYDDAVLALSTLPKVFDTIGEEMCLRIYVEAGIDALKKGNDGTARYRIQTVFEKGKRNKANEDNAETAIATVEERYDVFILCNNDDEENGKKLLDIMIRMGLKSALNTERLHPGRPIFSGMTDEMKKSNHFAIIFDFDPNDNSVANRIKYFTEQMQSIVQDREPGSSTMIVIKANTGDTVPDMFLPYKTIDMVLQTVPEDFTKDENACKSVKELLIALSSSS